MMSNGLEFVITVDKLIKMCFSDFYFSLITWSKVGAKRLNVKCIFQMDQSEYRIVRMSNSEPSVSLDESFSREKILFPIYLIVQWRIRIIKIYH